MIKSKNIKILAVFGWKMTFSSPRMEIVCWVNQYPEVLKKSKYWLQVNQEIQKTSEEFL